jgi:hypothetical protein
MMTPSQRWLASSFASEGQSAQAAGLELDQNPYARGTEEHAGWLCGWLRGWVTADELRQAA